METIYFTSAFWHEVKPKLDIYRQMQPQVQAINISKYTEKFEKLLVIFQCFPADIKSRKVETFKKIRHKTKTLELYLVLDYNRIMQGTDEENLQHIKEVFLQGCETFLKDMKGFDWEGFLLMIKG